MGLGALLFGFGACAGDGDQGVAPEVKALTAREGRANEDALREAIAGRGTGLGPEQLALSPEHFEAVLAFYAAREHRPLWVDDQGATRSVRALISALCDASADGLNPADYDTTELEKALRLAAEAPKDVAPLADVEWLATATWLRFAGHLSVGRIPPKQAGWHIEGRTFEPAKALTLLAEGEKVPAALEKLRPPHPEYAALRKTLAKLRELEAKGGWPELAKGRPLKPGMSDARVVTLRKRLHVTGELGDLKDSPVFDDELAAAVRTFQERHGLEPDGEVGGETLASLRVPVQRRIDQVIANLERWRWMPDPVEGRAIVVNIPAFQLETREGDKVLDRMRVIVGLPDWETPVFQSELDQVVFKPQWAVPKKILSQEILPKLQEDSQFAAQAGLRVYDEQGVEVDPASVDWGAIDPKQGKIGYRFRQPPGDDNPLGNVKFMMPNRFTVFLHDTPNDRLFQKAWRSYSHGCVRVEKPVELSQFALDGTPEWDDLAIQQVFETRGRGEAVKPARPPRVYLTYFTAFVDEQGVLQLRTDLYQRDQGLLRLLRQRGPGADAPELCG